MSASRRARSCTVLALLLALALPFAPGQSTYTNGPFVSHPGQGPVTGSDGSVKTLPNIANGYGCMLNVANNWNNRLADDFTVPCGEVWVINSFTVFGYQLGTGGLVPASTLNHANYRIWNSQPGSPGALVLHDFSTANQLQSSTFTNCYRLATFPSTVSDKPIYDAVMSGNNLQLGAGTYWLDFQLGGSPSYNGPWSIPISIPGQPACGNAVQQIGAVSPALAAWQPVIGSGFYYQGFPFLINYTMGMVPCWSFTLSQTQPGGNLSFIDSGGVPGNVFFNVVTLNQGSFPFGPFFGLDMSLGEIFAEIAVGPPFTGILNGGGASTLVIPGTPQAPIPSLVPLYAVGIQGDYAGFLQATPPFSYTTL